MKIINLSYQRFQVTDPLKWIEGFRLFYGIWEEVSKKHRAQYWHFSDQEETIVQNGLEHRFQKLSSSALRFPWRLHRKLRNENSDAILVHGIMFPLQILLLAMQCPDVKIWVQHHAEGPVWNPIKRWLQKKADQKIEGYFFCGKEMARPWLDTGLIRDPERIHELMEVSSVFEKESKTESRIRLNITSGRSILWVGHLNENKNPLLAVAGFLKLIESEDKDVDLFLIFQSNQLLSQLEILLQQHSKADRVHLIGKVAHEEMQHWYSAADFILSTSYYEGSGTAICEAMSCGCVPILSDISSFRFMAGTSGFLFEAGNEISLTNVLRMALTTDYELESQKAKRRFKEALSFEAIAKSIAHALGKVIS